MAGKAVDEAEIMQWITRKVRRWLVWQQGRVNADSSRRLLELAAQRSPAGLLRWLMAVLMNDKVAENRIAAFIWTQLRRSGKVGLLKLAAFDANVAILRQGGPREGDDSDLEFLDDLHREIVSIFSMPEAQMCFVAVFRDSVRMALREEIH